MKFSIRGEKQPKEGKRLIQSTGFWIQEFWNEQTQRSPNTLKVSSNGRQFREREPAQETNQVSVITLYVLTPKLFRIKTTAEPNLFVMIVIITISLLYES